MAVARRSASSSSSSTKKSSGSSGYNPYNGNYYGDGSDAKTNSKGEKIANDKTNSTTNTYGQKINESNRSTQEKNARDYVSKAEASGNKSAADYGREQLRRLANNEDLQYTYRYDGRGYGYNGNTSNAGREYTYDPYTGKSTGNLKMKNSAYDLMLDPQYNHGASYFAESYAGSPWLNELERQGKLVDGETAKSLSSVYANNWLRQNQYQPGNEFYTNGEYSLYKPIQQQALETVRNNLSSSGGYSPIQSNKVASTPSYEPIEGTPVNNDPIQPYNYNFNTLPTPTATPNFNPINIQTDKDRIKVLEEQLLKLKGGLSFGSL